MFEVIIDNEYEKLKEKIEEIKAEVAELIQEKYDITCYVLPALLTTFTETLGSRKRRILAQELMVEELKYRIKLAQAAKNRQETITVSVVDEKVRQEYAEYEKKQEEQFEQEKAEQEERQKQQETREDNQRKYEEKYGRQGGEELPATAAENEQSSDEQTDSFGTDNAGHEQSAEEASSREETKEETKKEKTSEFEGMTYKQKLKAIYKKLVKMLHPDVKQDFSEKEKMIWNNVQKAYNDGDLEALEKIYDEINELDIDDIPNDINGILQLKEMLEKLEKQKEILLKELHDIKNSFPYTEKEFLEDEEKVKALCDKYDRIIAEYEQQIEDLTDRYNELIK